MQYMLDTNISIYLIKQQPREVIEKFLEIPLGEIVISTVTIAEMMFGVEKSQYKEMNRTALELFLAPLEIVPFDFNAAQRYGVIREFSERLDTPIGAYDLMIAAQAQSLGLILVTTNLREFSRIPDLRVENWVS